ncbi:hypothetical protein H0H92_010604, partial [Tricholoma furcatifolium]
MADIFVDQTSPAIRVYGGVQNTLTSTAFIGSTALQFSGPVIISLTFNGTFVYLYGAAEFGDPRYVGVPVNVTIDGGNTTTIGFPKSSTLGLLYEYWQYMPPSTVASLADGPYTTINISMGPLASGIIDYMVVDSQDLYTPLLGQQLIIDDANVLNDPLVVELIGRLVLSGTAIAVYGPSLPGYFSDLQINYTLDAEHSQIRDYADSLPLNSNFQWYLNDTLAPGKHTLRIEVLSAVNSSFTIDYAL